MHKARKIKRFSCLLALFRPAHAKNFEVTYKNFLKEVTIRTPGAGDQKYTLHLCNSSGTDRSIGVPVNKLAVGRTDVQSLAFLEVKLFFKKTCIEDSILILVPSDTASWSPIESTIP